MGVDNVEGLNVLKSAWAYNARKGRAYVGVDFVHAEARVEVCKRSQRRSDLAQKHE